VKRKSHARTPAHVTSHVVTGVIEKLVPGGVGLLKDSEGVLFARGGLPGERVEVDVTRKKGGTRHGMVIRVLEASPDRVAPDCTFHPACGGCDLLDLAPRAQPHVKQQLVLDALARVGRFDDVTLARVQPIAVPQSADEGARRRVRVTLNAQGRPGFFARESHHVVPVTSCAALVPALSRVVAQLAGLPAHSEIRLAIDDRGHIGAALTDGPHAARLADELIERGCSGVVVLDDHDRERLVHGDPVLRGEVAPGVVGGPYLSCAGTFTQATRFGARTILQRVVEAVAPSTGQRVVELFCGSGHLTLPLAHAGAQVTAVEGAGRGVHWLRENLALCSAANVTVVQSYIDGNLALPDHDVLVADPPRTGIEGFAALIARSSARRLVLVSCDPATGARDLALARAGGFVVDAVWPIDAFPRTTHVEWVAQLSRGS
jgi:23S rRNA (uracil1939-C5)-methyltransferase